MKEIIELNKRILTEAPEAVPKEIGFIMVSRKDAASGGLAALPASIRADLEPLRLKLNQTMPTHAPGSVTPFASSIATPSYFAAQSFGGSHGSCGPPNPTNNIIGSASWDPSTYSTAVRPTKSSIVPPFG